MAGTFRSTSVCTREAVLLFFLSVHPFSFLWAKFPISDDLFFSFQRFPCALFLAFGAVCYFSRFPVMGARSFCFAISLEISHQYVKIASFRLSQFDVFRSSAAYLRSGCMYSYESEVSLGNLKRRIFLLNAFMKTSFLLGYIMWAKFLHLIPSIYKREEEIEYEITSFLISLLLPQKEV